MEEEREDPFTFLYYPQPPQPRNPIQPHGVDWNNNLPPPPLGEGVEFHSTGSLTNWPSATFMITLHNHFKIQRKVDRSVDSYGTGSQYDVTVTHSNLLIGTLMKRWMMINGKQQRVGAFMDAKTGYPVAEFDLNKKARVHDDTNIGTIHLRNQLVRKKLILNNQYGECRGEVSVPIPLVRKILSAYSECRGGIIIWTSKVFWNNTEVGTIQKIRTDPGSDPFYYVTFSGYGLQFKIILIIATFLWML